MNQIKLFFAWALFSSVLCSCSKLDYSEASIYSKDDIFSDFYRSTSFLNHIYGFLPSDFNSIGGAMRSSASDDAEFVSDLSAVQKFNDGSWNAIQAIDAQWDVMYSGIRATNMYLKESEGQTFEALRYNDGYKEMMIKFNLYPFEARFLRAFFYFELIKRYGDVPLITTVLIEEEANKVEKASFDSIIDFIVSECDDISTKLPESYTTIPGAETGRATKGAALALKSRALLYAASPLHNASNDQTRWIQAANAAKVIIDLQLYALSPDYGDVVNNLAQSELIFETRQGASNEFERTNFPIGFEGGGTGNCPTQNLVDAYEMKDSGKGIDEPGSGYDSNNPYAGRDPRFSQTIFYSGSLLKGVPIEIWSGGMSGPPNRNATKTGYYLKKYVIENVSLSPINPTAREHVWVLFRLGEVLLNYAEAMNEAYGPSGVGSGILQLTALDAVNIIRARVDMPAFSAGMTKESFRDKLQNERRVELAFEDHRFWDIRRWKIGDITSDIYGVEIVKDGSGNLSYTKKLVERRTWDDKMYLYPIPQNELFLNKALSPNNPGW